MSMQGLAPSRAEMGIGNAFSSSPNGIVYAYKTASGREEYSVAANGKIISISKCAEDSDTHSNLARVLYEAGNQSFSIVSGKRPDSGTLVDELAITESRKAVLREGINFALSLMHHQNSRNK